MNKALVIFSGGLDSYAALCWAKKNFDNVQAIGFNYGQRHQVETDAARNICKEMDIEYEVMSLPFFEGHKNALNDTSIEPIPHTRVDVPPPVNVVGRNFLFAMIAITQAAKIGATYIVTGIRHSQAFPDCRKETWISFQESIRMGVGEYIFLHPLMEHKNRGEAVKMIQDCGRMDLISKTVSCYQGTPACGKCKPCLDRAEGFAEFGMTDPALDSAKG